MENFWRTCQLWEMSWTSTLPDFLWVLVSFSVAQNHSAQNQDTLACSLSVFKESNSIDVTCPFQNEKIVEVISVMLHRNPMCKLAPEDVRFLQRAGTNPAPTSVFRLKFLFSFLSALILAAAVSVIVAGIKGCLITFLTFQYRVL